VPDSEQPDYLIALLLQGRRFPSKTWRWKRGFIPHCMDEGHDQAEIV
jgi:hypothetical protein